MPRTSRNLLGGILCHHMVQGINREYIFEENEEKECYLSLLRKYHLPFNINVVAYCIMDNHAHMLLYAEGDKSISDFMRQVNSVYAMYYNKKKERVGYVYRNRFHSVHIMTREQMHKCIKYIHMNPVKAGMVENESQYQYSSYQDYLNQTGFINQEILKFVFSSSKNYIEKFKKIEYENLDLENDNQEVEKVLENFMKKERITFSEMRKSKILAKKFIGYLISNQYKISKQEIARVLPISRSTLYRWLNGK